MFNIPNLFTAANLLSGCIAILLAVTGRIDIAPFAIFAGAFFDFLDGFLARKLQVSSELGKQLDSLADMVTFGVAPGMIMMSVIAAMQPNLNIGFSSYYSSVSFWLTGLLDGSHQYYYPFAGLIIPFFSLFRLAKFNLDIRQTEAFIGLPTPANTLFFMSFPLAMAYMLPESKAASFIYQIIFNPLFLTALILLMGVLLVSEIPLFSLKIKSFNWKGNEIRYSFLLISLVFILFFHAWSLALIVFLYLILSMIENTFKKTKKDEI